VELSRRTVLQPGDTLLLCTDGLWGPLSGRMIGAALAGDDIMRVIPELLDTAELRSGRECDNLSVLAMTWADTREVGTHQVSTATLGPSTFTTKLEEFGTSGGELTDLSDDEIEHAIAEIRNAVRRHSGT
jgi:serine/threonine protein phosphatase PrpC